MSHIDIQTTLSYQQNNPLAISLVFNPQRVVRQIELADKKGDPDKQLKNDPGFKIFRLDDTNRGIEASYHPVDYHIEGFDNMEQLVSLIKKFIVDVTLLFPKEKIPQTYENIIEDSVNQLNSLIIGTEEYLTTLSRKGETHRIPEVLQNQTKEILKFVDQTNNKIEEIKELMDFLEYKEKEIIKSQVTLILSKWYESAKGVDNRLKELSKKF
ncbi:MAG: hypothetical protein ACFFHD_11115 [Promethearchaeota archaeon]